MIKLLGRQTSGNVQKVLFLLEELHIPYTREDYGRQFGNTQTDAYRALNPNAKVPTMIDGDLVIWESHTIVRYLAALHAPALHGATPRRKAPWSSAGWTGSRRAQYALRGGVQGRQERTRGACP